MKKASLNIPLMEIIGLIVGSLVIISLLFFVTGISELFKTNPEQAMYTNFNSLVASVNGLVEEKKAEAPPQDGQIIPAEQNDIEVIVPIYIQNGFMIVGFDKESITETCHTFFNDEIKKPTMCLNLPCLCLMSGKDKSLQCETIKNVNQIFNAKTEEENKIKQLNNGLNRATSGSDLVLLGECGLVFKTNFAVRDIKIIKKPNVQENGKFDLLFDVLNT